MNKLFIPAIWGVLHSCMLLGLLFLLHQYLLGTALGYAFNRPITIDWPSNILFLAFIGVILILLHLFSGQLLIQLGLLEQQDKHLWGSLLGIFWAVLFSFLIGSVLYSFSQILLPSWRLHSTVFVTIVSLIWLVEAILKYWILNKRLHIRVQNCLIWWLFWLILLVTISTQLQDIPLLGILSGIGFGIFQTGLLWDVLQKQKCTSFQKHFV